MVYSLLIKLPIGRLPSKIAKQKDDTKNDVI